MTAGALALSLLATPSLALVANATTVIAPDESAESSSDFKLHRIATVPFSTVIVEDPELPVDVEVVKTAGINGLKYVYTTPAYYEGVVPMTKDVFVQMPVDEVIHRGTKIELPVAAEPVVIPEPEPEPEVQAADRSNDRVEVEAYVEPSAPSTSGEYSLGDLMFMGVINWGGYKFTYYSQSVLPGGGLSIPGRHVNAGGFVSDGDGYIVLAGSAPMGTVYSTPFGWPGKIYDRGTVGNHLDVYTQ
ncbi:G5 domain-containing protein [Actinomyces minihominis]|uniref:G5 domain-containing protein n=1 Tax=Actinomyces minihominis TaxID=2002838 RepID=UPI0013EC7599|nr:G5 domain-containing protein [Actinomyces minihominis]